MRSRCCVCASPLIVARQQLGRNVIAVTNTHTTTEELLDTLFPMWPVLYQGKQVISYSQNFLFSYLQHIRLTEYILCTGLLLVSWIMLARASSKITELKQFR
jgi:hypothetical protein